MANEKMFINTDTGMKIAVGPKDDPTKAYYKLEYEKKSSFAMWKLILIIVSSIVAITLLSIFLTRFILKAIKRYQATRRQIIKERLNRIQKRRIRHILKTRRSYLKQQMREKKKSVKNGDDTVLSDFDDFIPGDVSDLEKLDGQCDCDDCGEEK